MIDDLLNYLSQLGLPSLNVILRYMGIAFVSLLALIFLIVLVRWVLRIRWKPPVEHKLKIKNAGNLPGKYRLFVDAPARDMAFEYWAQGRKITLIENRQYMSRDLQKSVGPQKQVVRGPEPGKSAPAVQASTNSMEATQPSSGQAPKLDDKKKELAGAAKKAKAGSQKALSMGRLVGSMLGTLGSLIPGSLGRSLKDASVNMQGQVQTAGTAVRLPEQQLQSVSSLKGQAGSLAGTVSGAKGGFPGGAAKPAASPTPGEKVAGATAETQPGKVGPVDQGELLPEPAAQPKVVLPETMPRYIETPMIQPGEDITINLRIKPKNLYRSQVYSYWLFSHQVADVPEISETFDLISSTVRRNVFAPKKTVRSFNIQGISPLYGVLTALLLILVVGVNLASAAALIMWLAKPLIG